MELDPGHVHSCVNLGALLCEYGRCADSVELFDRMLHFNRAIALKGLERLGDALGGYKRRLELAPAYRKYQD